MILLIALCASLDDPTSGGIDVVADGDKDYSLGVVRFLEANIPRLFPEVKSLNFVYPRYQLVNGCRYMVTVQDTLYFKARVHVVYHFDETMNLIAITGHNPRKPPADGWLWQRDDTVTDEEIATALSLIQVEIKVDTVIGVRTKGGTKQLLLLDSGETVHSIVFKPENKTLVEYIAIKGQKQP